MQKKSSVKAKPKNTKRKKNTPVRKDIFDDLRRQILSGELHYGQRLIETEIATRLKVSRTPVREAFRKLENEGLIEYSPGRGVTVSQLSREEKLELYAIRGVLEGLAARLAAQKIEDREVRKLKDICERMKEHYLEKQYKDYIRLHTEFNELIYRAADSPQLYEMVTRFHEYTERSQLRTLSVPNRFEAIQREHLAIVKALERRRPGEAEEAFRYHIDQARQAYLDALAPEELIAELTG